MCRWGLVPIQELREMMAGVLLRECSSCAMEGMSGDLGVWPAVELRRGQGSAHQGEAGIKAYSCFLIFLGSQDYYLKDPEPVLSSQLTVASIFLELSFRLQSWWSLGWHMD